MAWSAGVHVKWHHINVECDDPAPDADMEEDEYADDELEDDSYAAHWHGADSSLMPLRPSVLANVTFLQAFQPGQHAALGMPLLPPPSSISQGQPQMAAEGPDHSVLLLAQTAGHPGAESGTAHQSWEHGNHQSQSSRTRKNDEDSVGQKRSRLSGGAASNAQQGSTQQESMATRRHEKLDAVASFK